MAEQTFTVQNIPNNTTNVIMGLPFKPNTMAQGSMFSLARQVFNRQEGGGQGWFQSSQYTTLKGIVATGQSSTNPAGTRMSFAGKDPNSVRDGLRKCRAGGCTGPKKKRVVQR